MWVYRTGLEYFTGRTKQLQRLKQYEQDEIQNCLAQIREAGSKKYHNKLGTCQLHVEEKTLDGSIKVRVSYKLLKRDSNGKQVQFKNTRGISSSEGCAGHTSLEYCVKFRSLLSRTATAVFHMGKLHSHSPVTRPPSMCLGSHVCAWEIPCHALHEQEIQPVGNVNDTDGQRVHNPPEPLRSHQAHQDGLTLWCVGWYRRGFRTKCTQTFHLLFGFPVGPSYIAQQCSNNTAHVGYTQHVPEMPRSLPRCSAVKLHLCLSVTSRCQPDWWEWLCWTRDHMLCQAGLMQGKGRVGGAIFCPPLNYFLYDAGEWTCHETGAENCF